MVLLLELHVHNSTPQEERFFSLNEPLRVRDDLNALVFERRNNIADRLGRAPLQHESGQEAVPVDVVALDVVRFQNFTQIWREIVLALSHVVKVGRTAALLAEGGELAPLLVRALKHEVGRAVPFAVGLTHAAKSSFDSHEVRLGRLQVLKLTFQLVRFLLADQRQLSPEHVSEPAVSVDVPVVGVVLEAVTEQPAPCAVVASRAHFVLQHLCSERFQELFSLCLSLQCD